MRRIDLHYAFIAFIEEVLNDLFKEEGMAIPVDDFAELFLVICSKNNHMYRAKNVLTEILEELDANRNHIYAELEPSNGINAIVNANGLFLTINYLKKEVTSGRKANKKAWKNSNLQSSKRKIIIKRLIMYQSRIKGQLFVWYK